MKCHPLLVVSIALVALVVVSNTSSAQRSRSATTPAATPTAVMPSSLPKLTAEQQADIEKTLKTAQECFAAGDLQRAAHLVDLASKIDPGISPAMTTLAKWSAALGRADIARRLLDDAVDKHPNDPEALFLLADIARTEGRRTEAAMLLARGQELLEVFNDSPVRKQVIEKSMWSNLANLYEMRGDFDRALSCLNRLVALEGTSGSTHLHLGLVYFKRNKEGDEASGMKAFEKAFELDPTQMPPKALRAQIAMQRGEGDKAMKLLEEALAEHPEHASLLSFVATTQLSEGRFEEAKKTAELLRRKFPDSPDIMKLQGTLAMSLRNLDEAESNFRNVLEKRWDAEVVIWLVMILLEKDREANLAEAATMAEANLRRQPSQEGAILLAWTFFLRGETSTAERLLDQVLAGEKLSSNGAYFAAAMLADQGKTELAAGIIKAVVESKAPFFQREAAEKLLKKLENAAEQ